AARPKTPASARSDAGRAVSTATSARPKTPASASTSTTASALRASCGRHLVPLGSLLRAFPSWSLGTRAERGRFIPPEDGTTCVLREAFLQLGADRGFLELLADEDELA